VKENANAVFVMGGEKRIRSGKREEPDPKGSVCFPSSLSGKREGRRDKTPLPQTPKETQ